MDHVDGDHPGDVLRRERIRRRLTLAQVAQATRVRERYLEAIENESIHELPAPVYTVGFIQIYARYLSLDPAPLVRAYQQRLGMAPVAQVQPEISGRSYTPRRHRSLLAPAISAAFLITLAGYLYQQVATYVSGASSSASPPSTTIALAIPTPLPSPPLPPSPTPTPFPTPSPTAVPVVPTSVPSPSPAARLTATETPTQGVRIDAEILGRVWLQVEADGKVVFSGILMPGDHRTWTATKSVMLWSGNAGNVQITYNGRALGPLGPAGKVVKVTWSAPT